MALNVDMVMNARRDGEAGVSCNGLQSEGQALKYPSLMAAMMLWGPVAGMAAEDMVRVPAGTFLMGSDKVDASGQAEEYGSAKPWYVDERPPRKVHLPTFYIDKYEVTNAQYRDFVRKADYWVPPAWRDNGYLLDRDVLSQADLPTLRHLAAETFRIDADTRTMNQSELLQAIARLQAQLDDLPVTAVNWFNANDYCHWAGKRLPTEAEWEKAARGEPGHEFPWGDEWNNQRLNAGAGGMWEFGVAPVGSYPDGASPYGALDMAGNVMEWVQDWYQPYPGNTYQSSAYGKTYKVVRGGGWGGLGHYTIQQFYRTAYRLYMKPADLFVDIGFRCAKYAS